MMTQREYAILHLKVQIYVWKVEIAICNQFHDDFVCGVTIKENCLRGVVLWAEYIGRPNNREIRRSHFGYV